MATVLKRLLSEPRGGPEAKSWNLSKSGYSFEVSAVRAAGGPRSEKLESKQEWLQF